MTSELEALYHRLDQMHMTEADRHLAKIQLARAEALVELCAAVVRLIRGRSAQAPRSSGLAARASS